MNVLLVSPIFAVSFWGMPEVCRFEGAKVISAPGGLLTVAALLPEKWELRLVDLNAGPIGEEDWTWADVVMVSAMMHQKPDTLRVIREAKHRGKTVVAGGPYPTSVPDDALGAGADLVVRGEAETCMDLVVSRLEGGSNARVITEQGKPDITRSPVPRFDLLKRDDYVTIGVQTSRGCPFDCEFCDVVNLNGRKPRCKTPEQVIRELQTLYELGWRRDVFISDDNFIGNKSHARALLKKLIPWQKSRGEPFWFWCQASVNLGQDLELIDLMTEANFHTVFVGIESPDADVLKQTHKLQNVRNPVVESLLNINKNGLTVMASFIIGFDGEKKGVGDRICALVEEANIPLVMLNLLGAIPNTRLWHRLKKEGRLVGSTDDYIHHKGALTYIPTRPRSEIVEDWTRVWERLYEPSRFLTRTYRYYLNMRPTRLALAIQRGESPHREGPTHKPPLKRALLHVWAFAHLVWRLGILSACRGQFWKQLYGMRWENPSRLRKYLVALGLCHDLHRFSKTMLQDARRTNKVDESPADTSSPSVGAQPPGEAPRALWLGTARK